MPSSSSAKAEGVDASRVTRHPRRRPASASSRTAAAGHKFDYLRKNSGGVADGAAERWPPTTSLAPGSSISRRSARRSAPARARPATPPSPTARAAGVKVSYDTNLRLRLWDLDTARGDDPRHHARAATLPLPSLDDSQQLTGPARRPTAIADFYLKLGAPLVALKMGSRWRPARHARRAASACAPHQASRRSTRRVQATRSTARFLARLLEGDDPEAAARYANVAAALSTSGYGAVTPIPRQAEVLAALRAR